MLAGFVRECWHDSVSVQVHGCLPILFVHLHAELALTTCRRAAGVLLEQKTALQVTLALLLGQARLGCVGSAVQ